VLAPSVVPAGTESNAPALSAIGFLTVLDEGNGYVGGYLVTNVWGRPLEFRLTSAVQPNRVQQILYGETLVPYLCGDLIGKTLVDKSSRTLRPDPRSHHRGPQAGQALSLLGLAACGFASSRGPLLAATQVDDAVERGGGDLEGLDGQADQVQAGQVVLALVQQ
jgi:hypothetical protein